MTWTLDDLVALDTEIELAMDKIHACRSLPGAKRALATTRLHAMVRLLEETRHKITSEMGLEQQVGL